MMKKVYKCTVIALETQYTFFYKNIKTKGSHRVFFGFFSFKPKNVLIFQNAKDCLASYLREFRRFTLIVN